MCNILQEALFKRYSVRKLSLDHFYVASKWKEEVAEGKFVMLNNTFVPPGETGFELATDDDKQKKAKAEIFSPTFERIWRCVVQPFARMDISDAEMVFLHALLLWSPMNNTHVQPDTKETMRQRREWAIQRLFENYEQIGQEDPPVRFGEVCSLLAEIEVICDQHCQDFQVAKLFEFCDMSQYWYEKWCYSSVNTIRRPEQSSLTPPVRCSLDGNVVVEDVGVDADSASSSGGPQSSEDYEGGADGRVMDVQIRKHEEDMQQDEERPPP